MKHIYLVLKYLDYTNPTDRNCISRENVHYPNKVILPFFKKKEEEKNFMVQHMEQYCCTRLTKYLAENDQKPLAYTL